LRFLATAKPVTADNQSQWLKDARRLLNTRFAFDRMVLWSALVGFAILATYGALSGVKQELTARGSETPVWNIGGFPHQYAFGLASWIILGLLVIAMLAHLWQRRRPVYLLGAFAALALVCPLVASWWESQIATASAWRWVAMRWMPCAVTARPCWQTWRSGSRFPVRQDSNALGPVRDNQAAVVTILSEDVTGLWYQFMQDTCHHMTA